MTREELEEKIDFERDHQAETSIEQLWEARQEEGDSEDEKAEYPSRYEA